VLARTLCSNYSFHVQFSFFTRAFGQEEKLEPLKNTTDDPRIRLLNRLYAKKRKGLKERGRLKVPHCSLFILIILQYMLLSNVVFISKC
jgi:hypothetical protein